MNEVTSKKLIVGNVCQMFMEMIGVPFSSDQVRRCTRPAAAMGPFVSELLSALHNSS
jgi:hypothetical protein